jgi:hypothetical protein
MTIVLLSAHGTTNHIQQSEQLLPVHIMQDGTGGVHVIGGPPFE